MSYGLSATRPFALAAAAITLAACGATTSSARAQQSALTGTGTGTLTIGNKVTTFTRVEATLADRGKASLRLVGDDEKGTRLLNGWWRTEGGSTVRISLRPDPPQFSGKQRIGGSGTLRVTTGGSPPTKTVAEIRLDGGADQARPFLLRFVATGETPPAAPEPTAATTRGMRTISGTVTYRERIRLPAPTVRVRLVHPARPGVRLAEQTLTAPAGPPYRFALACDPADVRPGTTYRIDAEVLAGGLVRFFGSAPYPGRDSVAIVAKIPPVGEDPETMASEATGEALYRERIALPPGSLLKVRLMEQGAQNAIVGRTIPAKNGTTPFALFYDPNHIAEGKSYVVTAAIVTPDGRIRFRGSQPFQPDTALKILLVAGQ